jgi:hypothetical protein
LDLLLDSRKSNLIKTFLNPSDLFRWGFFILAS